MNSFIRIGMLVKHYKRQTVYKVIATAKLERNLQPMVVYQDVKEPHHVWIRHVDEFVGHVNDKHTMFKDVRRFGPMDEHTPGRRVNRAIASGHNSHRGVAVL